MESKDLSTKKQSQPSKLTKDERKLVEDNIGLAYHMAQKYYIPNNSFGTLDDYIQIACVGLIKGAKGFDPSRGFQPSTYLGRTISTELYMMFRKEKKRNTISYNEFCDLNQESEFLGFLEDKNNEFEKIEEKLYIEQFKKDLQVVMSQLSEKEVKIIQLRYFEDKTQGEIASELNLSQSYICRVIKHTMEKIKLLLEEFDYY